MKYILTLFLFCIFLFSNGQDRNYILSIVDTLASPGMQGRGYVNNGDKLAADFIASEFSKAGLQSFNVNYFQSFSMPINTFPDSLYVTLGKKQLEPGKAFTVVSNSPSVQGTFPLIKMMADSTKDVIEDMKNSGIDFSDKVVVTDLEMNDMKRIAGLGAVGYIFLVGKVGWHVSSAYEVKDYFSLEVSKAFYNPYDKEVEIKIQNRFIKNYQTQNVIGYIKGKKHPDKFVVISAHYDHLGQMGPLTFFPGANDNASGTAMLLDLVKHYSNSENQPHLSMVFMAFAAEEAGLIGSSYYVTHPLFPLSKIQFLINLDMVGSGSEGIKVVNGAVFEKEFRRLKKINDKHEYLVKVSKRGEAANSDHYPFYYKGVPSFFIYTLGPECKEYHNIYDNPSNLPFTEYEDLFALLTGFIKTF